VLLARERDHAARAAEQGDQPVPDLERRLAVVERASLERLDGDLLAHQPEVHVRAQQHPGRGCF
jgi:hypothetical protein